MAKTITLSLATGCGSCGRWMATTIMVAMTASMNTAFMSAATISARPKP
jgi:hypothetical protein